MLISWKYQFSLLIRWILPEHPVLIEFFDLDFATRIAQSARKLDHGLFTLYQEQIARKKNTCFLAKDNLCISFTTD